MTDITSQIKSIVTNSGCKEGVVTVMSKHSTCGLMVNEWEARFVDDARQFLLELAPREGPYLHNDLDFRAGPPGYPGGDEAWREMRQGQPVNAHSHLIAFIVGNSEAIPVHKGALSLGTFQSIILVDADGPVGNLGSKKNRTVVVQVQGDDQSKL